MAPRLVEFLRRQPPWRLVLAVVASVAVLGLGVWGITALLRPAGEQSAPVADGTSEPPGAAPGTSVDTSPTGAPSSATPGGTPGSGTPGGGASTPPPTADAIARMESKVVALVNAERADAGCAAVTVDSRLATVAREHARDMATRDYFSHSTPEGVTFDDRIRDGGYPVGKAAENIALGQPSPEAVMEAWLASPDHRANIVDCGLRQIGVGLAYDASGRPYWAQSLASPA